MPTIDKRLWRPSKLFPGWIFREYDWGYSRTGYGSIIKATVVCANHETGMGPFVLAPVDMKIADGELIRFDPIKKESMTEAIVCPCDALQGCTCGAFAPIYDGDYDRCWKVTSSKRDYRRGFLWSQERYEFFGGKNGNQKRAYYDPLTHTWLTAVETESRFKNSTSTTNQKRIEALNARYRLPITEENQMGNCACNRVCGCGGGSTDPFVITRMKLENEIASSQNTLNRLDYYTAMNEPTGTVRWTRDGVTWFAHKSASGWDIFRANSHHEAGKSWGHLVTTHLICAEDVEIADYQAVTPASTATTGTADPS